MRVLIAAGGLAAMLTLGTPVLAQSPVSTQPLGASEVLLEVSSQGVARASADRAQVIVNASGSGADDAAAAAALESSVARVRQAAAAAGVTANDVGSVRTSNIAALMGAGGSPAQPMSVARSGDGAEDSEEATAKVVTKSRAVQITLRDVQRLASLRTALERLDVGSVSVTYELSENAPAHREARASALAQARAQAEVYATAMNMRVARAVRVSERISASGMGVEAVQSMMQMFLAAAGADSESVEATVNLSVDFALAPR